MARCDCGGPNGAQPRPPQVKTAAHWKKIGQIPHHGICLPLFSIRSKNSSSVGEFLDLLPLLDWCKTIHFDSIQLLPLNDTGNDPSPYDPISAFALDPVYLSLSSLPDAHEPLPSPSKTRLEIKEKKLLWLRGYFAKTFSPQDPSYQNFIRENPWLESYALFMVLRDKFGQKHWADWPNEYSSPKPHHFKRHEEELHFHRFIQFLCFNQLKQVRAHATQLNIFLIGDLPILVSPNSADVWANRSFFDLTFLAGAPPDAYNAKGQNWGFPIFNWDNLRKANFSWVRERLKLLEQFFHIYRIDHVVGLFRIWAIPWNNPEGGAFIPHQRELWKAQGLELLNLFINSTSLLPIAEDLGTIPEEVYSVLKDLGICGTKVVRWQKMGGSFVPFSDYEPLSMTTLSTPDMPPLALWWKNSPSEAALFAEFMRFPYHPILSSRQRLQILKAAHSSSSYFHINLLEEYLALFPELVWPNLEEERINVPGTLLPTNWTYRFRPSLEEIISHQGLNSTLQQMR